ncbi:MAG: gas vesicle protein GvpO [Alphaproteobacteria bacterium]
MQIVMIEESGQAGPPFQEKVAMGARDIALRAKAELQEITGLKPDTVSKVQKGDEGWLVNIDMVEHRSIPESRDVLATYELVLDGDGTMLTYERVRRFIRGQTEE